LNTKELLLSDR